MRRTRPLSPRTTSCNNRGPPRHPRRRHCARVAEQSQSRSRRKRPPPGGAGGGASHRSHSFPSFEDCRTARPEKACDAPQEGACVTRGPPRTCLLRPLDPLVVPSCPRGFWFPVTVLFFCVIWQTVGTVCSDSNLGAHCWSRDGDSVDQPAVIFQFRELVPRPGLVSSCCTCRCKFTGIIASRCLGQQSCY